MCACEKLDQYLPRRRWGEIHSVIICAHSQFSHWNQDSEHDAIFRGCSVLSLDKLNLPNFGCSCLSPNLNLAKVMLDRNSSFILEN